MLNLMYYLLVSLLVLPSAHGSKSRCSWLLGGSNYAQRDGGSYTFRNGRVIWVSTDGRKIQPYFTASASHREILRRQLGEVRFNEIMASRDPEAAARVAVASQAATSPMKIRMTEIPLDKPLPPEMIDEVLLYLQSAGIYAPTFEDYLRLNLDQIPELGRRQVDIKFVDVKFLTGSREKFGAGDESQVIKLRLYKPLYEFDPVDTTKNFIYHIRIVEAAKGFISEERLLYKLGHWADPGTVGAISLGVLHRKENSGYQFTVANEVPPMRGRWRWPVEK